MELYIFQFGCCSHLCVGFYPALLETNKPISLLLRDCTFIFEDPKQLLTATATTFVLRTGLETYIVSTARYNDQNKKMPMVPAC
jgi:hypothetical protein